MQHIPEIAIVEPNTLTALGLRTILEELIPESVIRTFSSFGELIADTPDMYAHYFISAQIYFSHTAFFLERRPKSIVLAAGEQPQLTGIPTLNICLPQDRLVKAIMELRRDGHASVSRPVSPSVQDTEHELSPREIEVLVLVTKGFILKIGCICIGFQIGRPSALNFARVSRISDGLDLPLAGVYRTSCSPRTCGDIASLSMMMQESQ